jgi:hypothetical protein
MSDDQFHLGCAECWTKVLWSEQHPAGIFDHRHEGKAMRRFKITLNDGSTAHVTAAGFKSEDCIVFYDGDGAEVKTLRAGLWRSILDEAAYQDVVEVYQNDLGSA